MDNSDLTKIMQHYRKEARKVVNQYAFRKIASFIIIFMVSLIGIEFNFLWMVTIVFAAWIVLWINKFYSQPQLTMHDSFYKDLALLDIQDKDALGDLKNYLKSNGYLSLDQVEDFIEIEKRTRALNDDVSKQGAKELLKT